MKKLSAKFMLKNAYPIKFNKKADIKNFCMTPEAKIK